MVLVQEIRQQEGMKMVSGKTSARIEALLLIIGGAALAFLLISLEESSAETITVDDDGGADYERIQDAINAAGDGDTVRVYENGLLPGGAALLLLAADGRDLLRE